MQLCVKGGIQKLNIHRAAEDLILISHDRCTCVFTFSIDPRDGETVVVGGRNCDKWPACQFPIHLAMRLAQMEFDRDAITPTFELIEATPEP